MATDNWQNILKELRQLSPEQLRAIIDEVRHRSNDHQRERSVCELSGLGAAIWDGVDAQDYVRRERESWSG